MSEFNINVTGGTSVRLPTAGKYCDRDIIVTAQGGGGGDLPPEALTISGDCEYRFAYGGWDWFIDTYGDFVTTSVTKVENMFTHSNVSKIPFNIKCSATTAIQLTNMFDNCKYLESIPKMSNFKPDGRQNIFSYCYLVRHIPEETFDNWNWSTIDESNGNYNSNASGMFRYCHSLRALPMIMFRHFNRISVASYSIYNNAFSQCFALDEVVEMPVSHTDAAITSNMFSSTFTHCWRLKNFTFELNNGTPYAAQWKAQTIDLSSYVGYGNAEANLIGKNSGITADKKVSSASTYAALKNDADWYTLDMNYSRYNHDSAVATINSLPDTSAYLATAGGTNTIKFRGASGASTDGGAINTLTEAEIAVATAKGWTVTFA